MYVNYEYYRIFYYVAKYKNVSQAAKILSANQPNLSRSIKILESELGCPLFVRTNRGMNLTSEGEKLFARVQIAFENIEAAEAEIIESRNIEKGSVFVAASEVALRCFLLPVLREYRMKYPSVRLRISNHSTPQAIDAVRSGVADMAVVTTPIGDPAAITQRTLRRFREVAVCSSAFSELLGREVPLSELVEYPVVSLGSQTGSFEAYTEFFTGEELPFKPDIEAATADQILPMVKADLGIGFVPEDFLAGERGVYTIATDKPLPEREIKIVKRKGCTLGVAAAELEKFILKA